MGIFSATGGRNNALFAADPTSGSANGKPTSRGYTLLAEYIPFGKSDSPLRPFVNARFGLQYTVYFRFNGGQSNYDGAGRNAIDNNTLFFYTWVLLYLAVEMDASLAFEAQGFKIGGASYQFERGVHHEQD